MEQESIFGAEAYQPLAARLRPASLEEFVGQAHLLGQGKVLRRLIENDMISSMIFWGPPGVGKTTLARIIAGHTHARFIDFSAVTSGIREIRQVMQEAEKNQYLGEKTIVFVDEIHRFNKAQQDAFLPFVEKGIYGPGHNTFFEMGGEYYTSYHARPYDEIIGDPLYDPNRHAFIMKLPMQDGIPVFLLEHQQFQNP